MTIPIFKVAYQILYIWFHLALRSGYRYKVMACRHMRNSQTDTYSIRSTWETFYNVIVADLMYLHVLIAVLFFFLAQVGNLAGPVEEWTVGATPLTSLMDVERRHGNFLAWPCFQLTATLLCSSNILIDVYSSSNQCVTCLSCSLFGWLAIIFWL